MEDNNFDFLTKLVEDSSTGKKDKKKTKAKPKRKKKSEAKQSANRSTYKSKAFKFVELYADWYELHALMDDIETKLMFMEEPKEEE